MQEEQKCSSCFLTELQQLANNRQGTQKAKTRSEVRGGGRKPWRQKGTGHARQVAGIAGAVQYGNTIQGCTVKNSTIQSVGTGILILKGATPCAGGIVGQLAAASDSQKISIIDNTVENTTVTQVRTGTKYIGWAVGDANTRLAASQYDISGNEYIGTTTLNEVGYNPANPSLSAAE